ncbi:GntR family transcriptional regulator [Paraburkholderia azotifigens]|uniref:GntR family transcriptional regulator n=1 Tax=Paraburkholderia azotifigens TaxID=2057004 RepID=UPI00317DA2CC
MFPSSRISSDKMAWRPDFARIRGVVYLSIADQIESAIRSGLFEPGDTLPPQRALADDLGFHLNTINAAFREVARRGLVRGRAGRRGTVVLPDTVELASGAE